MKKLRAIFRRGKESAKNQEAVGRILLVDDESPFTRSLTRVLESEGNFEVHAVNRAQEALYAARAFRPDMILLDLMMPDGDGGEVASELLSDPRLSRVPVVFLTAAIKGSEIDGSGGMIAGRRYLAKPVRSGHLLACIYQALGATP